MKVHGVYYIHKEISIGNKKFFGVIMSKTSRKASLFVVKKLELQEEISKKYKR